MQMEENCACNLLEKGLLSCQLHGLQLDVSYCKVHFLL